ncbi:MAG TPA: PKD domain-containing protein, partial [Mycobacteriales bacterium]|nr:PKD domain-containing protein [Mycobacteriales bacterium]
TSCADGGVRLWVFRREVDRDTRAPLTGWDRLDGTICMDATADGAPAIARLPALVRQEWRNASLRASSVRFAPRDGGVVNLETIFHADTPPTFEVPVGPILGFDVTITAHATSYRWEWGDGTTSTTATPGAPYPARDVTHVYRRPGRFAVRVIATYRGTYTVDGSAPQPIEGTVAVPGPAVTLQVREARAQLVEGERG